MNSPRRILLSKTHFRMLATVVPPLRLALLDRVVNLVILPEVKVSKIQTCD
jgi:hypothetical protein